MRILLIEDDPSIVDTISLVFELSWPEVKLAHSATGTAGIAEVGKDPPDLVVLDLGLPDMDGIAALERIRQFSYVPVVILTARTQNDSIIKGLEAGADDYITKPF
ncbi:MAG: response regulator, partial [Candidatus Tectomicrobia bacterium]|nr:response regulator [Candidatus Tectomicrobia bacterium]